MKNLKVKNSLCKAKRFWSGFIAVIFLCFGLVSFSACGKKTDDLSKISTGLSNYDISIDFDNSTKSLTAKQKVNYVNNTDTVLKQVKFHLYPQFFKQGATDKIVSQTKMNNCYRHGMSYCEFEITKLKLADTEIAVVLEGDYNNILNVNLTNSLMPTERVDVDLEYYIKLPNCEHRFGYGDDTINLANFYPIACVYENGGFVTNPYNANGDPFYSDMSNYNVNLTLDSMLTVAGTGEQYELSQKSGKTTTQFKAKVVRDFACVISEKFEVKTAKANNVEVNYYFYNDGNADLALKTAVDSIKTFSQKFGEYPYTTFSVVKCDFLQGGMEYPNLVMISDDIDSLDDYLNVIVHETAHQWWYGLVGNDEYTLPWLDEALTEFSTALFYDYNEDYNLTHQKIVKANKENYTLFITVYEDVLGSIDTSMRAVDEYNTEPEYTYCTYVKGVLMYESLYSLVGEKKFVKSLQNYYQTNKFKNVTADELIEAFTKTTGNDMQSFFDSWIKGKVVIK